MNREREKLNWDMVREIRAAVGVSKADLARRYGVTESAIRAILTGRNWKAAPREYVFRQEDCDTCGGQGGITYPEGPGYVTYRCDDCDHTGQVDAACADCLVVKPLDDEGYCEKCADASSLPLAEFAAKHYPHLDIGRAA